MEKTSPIDIDNIRKESGTKKKKEQERLFDFGSKLTALTKKNSNKNLTKKTLIKNYW